jgi:hypothetical protein
VFQFEYIFENLFFDDERLVSMCVNGCVLHVFEYILEILFCDDEGLVSMCVCEVCVCVCVCVDMLCVPV